MGSRAGNSDMNTTFFPEALLCHSVLLPTEVSVASYNEDTKYSLQMSRNSCHMETSFSAA